MNKKISFIFLALGLVSLVFAVPVHAANDNVTTFDTNAGGFTLTPFGSVNGQVFMMDSTNPNKVAFEGFTTSTASGAGLSIVAITGSYSDLSNKPTIPAAQVNSDWNATSGVAQVLNKPTVPKIQSIATTTTGSGTFVWNFPSSFSGTPVVQVTPESSTSTGITPNAWVVSKTSSSVTIATSIISSILGILQIQSNPAIIVDITAVGN